MAWTEIDRYLVRHYTRPSTADPSWVLTSIIVYKDNIVRGYLQFYRPDHVPSNELRSPMSGGTGVADPYYVIAFPIDRVEEVIATLREEKPLHIGIGTTFVNIGWLGTGTEPVGEEEGV